MTPYAADEAALNMREQRSLFFAAPLIPVLMILGVIVSGSLTVLFGIALAALTVAVACLMRLIWQTAHFRNYTYTRENRVLTILAYSAVPIVLISVMLNIFI
ncbi:hypothetical protein ACR9WD_16955 (plasmid) [Glutamicibacter sp. PAEs-4]|uniref:hypothetical protein n=1 Tax=Glutamicibacter sp. PAEs-4 TaxID=3444114 RepID=UPI003EBA4500